MPGLELGKLGLQGLRCPIFSSCVQELNFSQQIFMKGEVDAHEETVSLAFSQTVSRAHVCVCVPV